MNLSGITFYRNIIEKQAVVLKKIDEIDENRAILGKCSHSVKKFEILYEIYRLYMAVILDIGYINSNMENLKNNSENNLKIDLITMIEENIILQKNLKTDIDSLEFMMVES